MRYIFIIGLFLFGCKTTNKITEPGRPDSFVILIQYNKGEEFENYVMQVLSSVTNLQHYEIRREKSNLDEIEATCFSLKDNKMDMVANRLQQTAGVLNVVLNPAYK